MILKPILQHYTDTMHLKAFDREIERNSPVFKLDNPVEFAEKLVTKLYKGDLQIRVRAYSRVEISGQTDDNELHGLGLDQGPISESCKVALHDFFNNFMVCDVKFLMDANGEKI